MNHYELPNELAPKELAHYMLDKIVEHFSVNPHQRRCGTSTSSVAGVIDQCFYSPQSMQDPHPDNIGCGIGMFLPPDVGLKIDRKRPNGLGVVSLIRDRSTILDDKKLPDPLLTIDGGILVSMQALHDWDSYWCREGLTESGKSKVEDIRESINNIYSV